MNEKMNSTNQTSRRTFLRASVVSGIGLVSACQSNEDKNALVADSNVQKPANKSAAPDITHREIQTNGIGMHIAEAGSGFPVIFLHGFMELSHSWKNQLPAIATAGFHAVAPDLRGFGKTDVPQDIESYSTRNRAADVIGLMDALSAERCVLVGNDWGSGLAWAMAQLHPKRVAAMFHLNIGYSERGEEPPTVSIGKFAKDHFNFALNVQEPGIAEAEFEKDVRATVRRFLYAFSGDAPESVVRYLFMEKKSDASVLEGMPEPEKLPSWLTEADVEHYATEYGRTGFRGPLGMYRNMDRDWKDLPEVGEGQISQPVLFMGGKKDPSVIYAPFDPMIRACPKLRKIVFLENVGHWVQLERPESVNQELIDFLRREIGNS